MTENAHTDIARQLHPRRIIIPIVIGLAVVVWIILKDVNINILQEIVFTWKSVFWLFVAFMLVVFRTFFYMVRIRILTNNDLILETGFQGNNALGIQFCHNSFNCRGYCTCCDFPSQGGDKYRTKYCSNTRNLFPR